MDIKKVAIYGAGNIGAYLIWGLQETVGSDNLWIVADGERKERLEREGLRINDEDFSLTVKTPEEAKGADVLFVAVKYGALRDILPGVKGIAGPGVVGYSGHPPIVMSLMNGVDSEEILAEVVDETQIVPAIIRISAEREGRDIFIHPVNKDMGIHFGDRDGNNDEENIASLTRLFEESKLEYTVSDDIMAMMWYKFGVNNAENQPQAILDVGLGAYRESEHVGWFRTQLWNEVKAVAKAEGIDLPGEPDYLTPHEFRNSTAYSTLQDVRAGRQTEVEMLAGTLMRRGQASGVPVPVATAIYHMLKAVDERSAGKFDWQD